jgi:hypothetical protein
MKIELGDKVKDLVSGHAGVVTQVVENLNGCIQYTVRAPLDKDGKMGEAYCIDGENLAVVKKAFVKIVRKAVRTGGNESRPAKALWWITVRVKMVHLWGRNIA